MKSFLSSIIYSKDIIDSLLLALLISLPFGSSLISFSVGFMTLYPGLIILFLLTLFGFFHLKNIEHPLEKYTLYFFLFWVVYALVHFFFVKNSHEGKVDVRSIILFALYSFNLIWINSYLGNKQMLGNVNLISKFIFFGLVIFSIFEIFTGIHFFGEFTNKLHEYPLASLIYSPVFLFDNPNNLTANVFLIGGLVLLTEKGLKDKLYLITLIYICCLFVCLITMARMAQYLLILIGVICLGYYFYRFYRNNKKTKKKIAALGLLIFLLSIHYVFLPKYYGPIWITEKSVKEHNLHSKKKMTFVQSKSIGTPILLSEVQNFNLDTLQKYYSSRSIRLSLIYNGLHFTEQSNFLGVGPGQFRSKHSEKDIVYYTGTNVGAHNGFIEILSQYGVLVLFGFLSIFFWVFFICIRNFKHYSFNASIIMVLMLVYAVLSAVPSGFLIMNINWLFLPILVITATSLKEKNAKE